MVDLSRRQHLSLSNLSKPLLVPMDPQLLLLAVFPQVLKSRPSSPSAPMVLSAVLASSSHLNAATPTP